MSNNETKTIQLKIVSPVAKKFIDTLVQKVTEEGWTYNYNKVFTNPFKVFLTKEVYIDSEEPDLTVVAAEYCTKGITPLSYDPNKVQVLIHGNAVDPSYRLIDEYTGEVGLLPEGQIKEFKENYPQLNDLVQEQVTSLLDEMEAIKDNIEDIAQTFSESILSTPDEPTSDSTEEEVPTALPEIIESVETPVEPENKVGDGNVYTLEQLKPIQWHKLTKIGSAYGLHAMKRGDMEAAIVELSQGNKANEE